LQATKRYRVSRMRNGEIRNKIIFTTEAHGIARKKEMLGFYLNKTGKQVFITSPKAE
jgi:hypothetical protein